MRSTYGYLSFFAIVGTVASGFAAQAVTKTNPDELYSETIYIQKSSAEVPTSIDSSARTSAAEEAVAAAPAMDSAESGPAIESIEEMDQPSPKKVSKISGRKKSSRN